MYDRNSLQSESQNAWANTNSIYQVESWAQWMKP